MDKYPSPKCPKCDGSPLAKEYDSRFKEPYLRCVYCGKRIHGEKKIKELIKAQIMASGKF